MSVRRYGKVLVYPGQGRLMFVTDFHGQIEDFQRVVARFTARLERGEDVYLLFAGDFVHGPVPGMISGWLRRDESVAILGALIPLMEAHPDRVHSLLGNHEHGHIGGKRTQKFYRKLDDDVSVLEDRLGPEASAVARRLFASFSLLALTPCGVMFTHAAPNLDPEQSGLLHKVMTARYDRTDPVVMSLLWPRTVAEPARMEAVFEALRFKGIRPRIAAYGHEIAPQGIDATDHQQIVVSSSFAVADRYKTFLDLDLSAKYAKIGDLRPGVELVRLYPERAAFG